MGKEEFCKPEKIGLKIRNKPLPMTEIEEKIKAKKIKLGIGNKSWPRLGINVYQSLTRQTEFLNFFSRAYDLTGRAKIDLRTVRKYLERASKQKDKVPIPAQYLIFQLFEDITNEMFFYFRQLEGNEEIDGLVESNSDHGYPHQRRLEKLLKEFLKSEKEYANKPDLFFFVLSSLIAIRFHDILEIFPDGKKNHAEGSALLVLGFLTQNREFFNQIIQSLREKNQLEINSPDDDTWFKIIASSFIICLYHSRPEESLKELEGKIKDKQIISLKDLLKGKPNLFQALTDLQERHKERQKIVDLMMAGKSFLGKFGDKITFSYEEAMALINSARVFAGLDKLDSILPAELSTARTLLTVKDTPRLFFAPWPDIVYNNEGNIRKEIIDSPDCQTAIYKIKNNLPLTDEDEYFLRLALGKGSFSPDDFSRLLFELQRVDFGDLPTWLMSGFVFALQKKGDFLKKMIQEILGSGKSEIFSSVYLQAEASLVTEFLSKYGKSEADINGLIVNFLAKKDPTERDEYIQSILKELGIKDSSAIFINLAKIREELSQLKKILAVKISQLRDLGLINDEIRTKAERLIDLAIQNRQLPNVSSDVFTSSYRSYYPITVFWNLLIY